MATRRMVYNEAIEKERDRDFRKKERELLERVKRRQIKRKSAVSTDSAKAKRLATKARRMEMLAGMLDDVSDDDAYYRRVTRAEKVYAASDRLKAKVKGKEAGVLIAKARKAKEKKAALTAEAKTNNRLANRERDIMMSGMRGGMDRTLLSAVKAEGKNMIAQGKAKRTTRSTRNTAVRLFEEGKMPHLTGFKIPKDRIKVAEMDQPIYRRRSKDAARKSGGTATGIKRTAEAALSRIVQGKALKRSARAGGVLGIAAMAAQALRGTEPKKKRG